MCYYIPMILNSSMAQIMFELHEGRLDRHARSARQSLEGQIEEKRPQLEVTIGRTPGWLSRHEHMRQIATRAIALLGDTATTQAITYDEPASLMATSREVPGLTSRAIPVLARSTIVFSRTLQ